MGYHYTFPRKVSVFESSEMRVKFEIVRVIFPAMPDFLDEAGGKYFNDDREKKFGLLAERVRRR